MSLILRIELDLGACYVFGRHQFIIKPTFSLYESKPYIKVSAITERALYAACMISLLACGVNNPADEIC